MQGLDSEWRHALAVGLFALLPLILSVGFAVGLINGHDAAFDFAREYRPAVQRWLHGEAPYLRTRSAVVGGVAFPYPATALLLLVPFAVLPPTLGAVLFTLVLLLAAGATVHALGVRDWRLYGLIFAISPVVTGWTTANLTLCALLAVAAAWRSRNSPRTAGALLALAVSLKPFLWPLGLWLWATRRHRAVMWSLAVFAVGNLTCFAIVGFQWLGPFLQDSRAVTDYFISRSYGIAGLVMHLGASQGEALAATFALAGVVAIQGFRLSRRDEASCLAAFTAVTFLASPILWVHYLALLVVPVALRFSRLDVAWGAAVLLWFCPVGQPDLGENLVAIAAVTALLAMVCFRDAAVVSQYPEPETVGTGNGSVTERPPFRSPRGEERRSGP